MEEKNQKEMAKQFMLKIMEEALKRSPINVPQPLPLVEEKAAKRLNDDDLISFKLILPEWNKISEDGKKKIAMLLTLNAYTIVEGLNFSRQLMDEVRDTAVYLDKHPEFKKEKEEVDAGNIMDNIFNELDM